MQLYREPSFKTITKINGYMNLNFWKIFAWLLIAWGVINSITCPIIGSVNPETASICQLYSLRGITSILLAIFLVIYFKEK